MKLAGIFRAAAVFFAAMWFAACPARAGGTPWPSAPYTYFANNVRLESVLADFASGFSLSLALQPEVTGVVNGRFATASPTEFLNKLSGMYGFVWYAHAGTLFVSRANDIVTRGVAAPGGNVVSMRKALADLGVLEPRFGWGELADHGMALVSGPPSYVQLIESTIRNLPARSQQMMVFKLRHASANDRVVRYRDADVTVPGLATILRAMIDRSGAPGSPVAATSPVAGAVAQPMRPAMPMGDPGLVGPVLPPAALAAPYLLPGAAQATPQPAIAATATTPGPRPAVQADPRINAVIVQDLPERMPLYQQLIAQLDVPTPLVEIEAMIVDINTDRADELGVNWSGRIGRTQFNYGQPASPSAASAILTFSSGATAAGSFLISQLRALESKGDAEIQSRPSLLTSENLTALLDLSETFYIRTQSEYSTSVVPVTAGTTLRVTPRVMQEGGASYVQLKIDIEDGKISDRQVESLPIVTRTTVSTEATVRHGEALLIAGYTSSRNVRSRDQVPLLGDIPGLGVLFSSTTNTLQKRERMFLIRPKVVAIGVQQIESAEPH